MNGTKKYYPHNDQVKKNPRKEPLKKKKKSTIILILSSFAHLSPSYRLIVSES
jgi:hypothetical protein